MAFDRNAYNMINSAISQVQARINSYSAALKTNPGGAGMLNAAIAAEKRQLAQYQAMLQQQQAQVPIQEAQYSQQKSDIQQQFGAQQAANDYARTIAQQRHGRQLGDFNVQASQQRNRFDSPYLQRGVFRSGIRQQGLSEMRQAQGSAYGQLTGQQMEEMGALDQQRAQMGAARQAALNAVDRARQQAIHSYLTQNVGG